MFLADLACQTSLQPHPIAALFFERRVKATQAVPPSVSAACSPSQSPAWGPQPCKRALTAPGDKAESAAPRIVFIALNPTFPRHPHAFPSSSLAYIANLALLNTTHQSRLVSALTLLVTSKSPHLQAHRISCPQCYTCTRCQPAPAHKENFHSSIIRLSAQLYTVQ
jgi:hypothetical protein